MIKIYCYIISMLFWGMCFLSDAQNTFAANATQYISNRIQIMRPEKTAAKVNPVSSMEDANRKKTPKISENTTASLSDSIPKRVSDIAESADIQAKIQKGTFTGQAIDAKETQASSEDTIQDEVSALIGKKERFYTRKGRIDPFQPFLQKPEPDGVTDKNALQKRNVPISPLQKFDLSQLTLTATLRIPGRPTVALVQDTSGKGYVVEEGDWIGNKGGYISKILKDRIKITEMTLDVYGKDSINKQEIKLQQ